MKLIRKNILYWVFCIAIGFISFSCEKEAANDIEWGTPKIYMPQAVVKDGGETNEYPVPLDAPYDNFKLDTISNTLNVTLGVIRSGLDSPEGFSVEVQMDRAATNEKIDEGSISNGIILPQEVYTLPAKVSVATGNRESNFNLAVDMEKLIENYPNYHSKKLVLVVKLTNPSKYDLNPSISSTTVIIDAKHFMPTPPIENKIKGGDMESSDMEHWVVQDSYSTFEIEFGYTGDKPADASGGNLRLISNDAENVNGTLYQAVEVEPGQEYQLSAKVKVPGGGDQFGVFFFVSDVVPRTEDYSEENNAFMGINTWWGCGTSPLDGDIRDIGCEGQGYYGNGLETDGIFTANASTIYIAIQIYEYGGAFGGDILIDDVLLVKVN